MSKLLQRLTDAKRSGVYRTRDAAAILDAGTMGALDVATIDLRSGVFESMADALTFPEWFGNNWDALEDCLSDLSWRRDAGRVLLLANLPTGNDRRTLLDVLDSAAKYWAARDKAFFAVILDPACQLPLPDLYRER